MSPTLYVFPASVCSVCKTTFPVWSVHSVIPIPNLAVFGSLSLKRYSSKPSVDTPDSPEIKPSDFC